MSNRKLKQTVLYRTENEKKNNIKRAINLFSLYVLLKFEKNGALEYYLLTCIGETKHTS